MKHQYFADRRDFIKYELLLDLAQRHLFPNRLLSILMLTPNDETSEGSVKSYDRGIRRGDLFQFLQGCLAVGTRDVSLLRSFMRRAGMTYLPRFDDQYFQESTRDDYFRGCATAARDHSLIFFDPDIGIETGTRAYMRKNGVEKYLMYEELSLVARAAQPSSVLVVYQHLQKNKNLVRGDIETRCREVAAAVQSKAVSFLTDLEVAFLVTGLDDESTRLASGVTSMHSARHGLEAGTIAA